MSTKVNFEHSRIDVDVLNYYIDWFNNYKYDSSWGSWTRISGSQGSVTPESAAQAILNIAISVSNLLDANKFLSYSSSPWVVEEFAGTPFEIADFTFSKGNIIDTRQFNPIIQIGQDIYDLRSCNSCVSRCTSSCKSGCTGCKGNCNGDGCKQQLVAWCTGCGKACKEYCGHNCLGGTCKSASCSNLCATGCKNSCESGCANSQRVGAFSV